MLFIPLFNSDYIFNFFFSPDYIEHCSWGLVVCIICFLFTFCKHIIIEKKRKKNARSPNSRKSAKFAKVSVSKSCCNYKQVLNNC